VQGPLGRAELIAAAGSAADAFAAGRPLPEGVTRLAGRDFEIRLAFGCPGGPHADVGALGADYDEAAKALRVRAEPVRWSPEDWLPATEGASDGALAVEDIEGFWISRPWTTSEACPSSSPAPTGVEAPPAASEQTLAIAQFFTSESSRVARRDGEAYQTVERVAPDALDISQGLRLRLRGRLAPAPGAGPVLCRAPSGGRPVCMVSAVFDEVAVEKPATGATLATWDVSSQNREPAS